MYFTGSSTLQNLQHNDDGFRISACEEILVVGLAVCWGGKDAYYISLQQKNEEQIGKILLKETALEKAVYIVTY